MFLHKTCRLSVVVVEAEVAEAVVEVVEVVKVVGTTTGVGTAEEDGVEVVATRDRDRDAEGVVMKAEVEVGIRGAEAAIKDSFVE